MILFDLLDVKVVFKVVVKLRVFGNGVLLISVGFGLILLLVVLRSNLLLGIRYDTAHHIRLHFWKHHFDNARCSLPLFLLEDVITLHDLLDATLIV